jgi:signal transduction histidine kinase/ActR/RegA family two-component response regulator
VGGGDDWRDDLSRRVVTAAIPLAAVGTAVALFLGISVGQRIALAAVSTVVLLSFAADLKLGWLRPRQRSWLIVIGITALGSAGYATFGPLSGPAAAAVCASVLASVLLGRRALFLVVGAILLFNAGLAFSMHAGLLPAPPLADVDPRSPVVWLRTVFIALLIAALVALVVGYVVERLETAVAASQAEVARREAAEVAGERDRAIAHRAQKLEAIGRLAAGVAHDFNNSLTVIQVWASMLEKGMSDEDLRAATASITEATKQAAGLASHLLVLGRRDARAPKDLELGQVVAAHAKSVGRLLSSEFQIDLDVEPRVGVFADEVQLHQILLNLTLNARDAMPRGGTIRIRAREEELLTPRHMTTGILPAGSYAVLSVEDTGVGMDASTLEHALEPFFTTKEAGRGTGLGLSTVVSIATQSGGQLDVESVRGEGTRVDVWLPLQGTQTGLAEVTAGDAAVPPGTRVLLVEDRPAVLTLMERILAEAGCSVTAAPSAGAALAKVEELQPDALDLLVTDAAMPGVPVSELLEQFERLCPHARIVVCSGYVGEELARRGIAEGRYVHLRKPFGPEALVVAVTAALRARKPSVSPRRAADELGDAAPRPGS